MYQAPKPSKLAWPDQAKSIELFQPDCKQVGQVDHGQGILIVL